MKNALQKTFSRTTKLFSTPNNVFPLLCPVKEYDWIPGWGCEMVYSNSGVAELGAIFTTDKFTNGKMVWTCTHYEPDKEIHYTVVKEQSIVFRLVIKLNDNGDGSTEMSWSRTFTALNEHGEKEIAKLNEKQFAKEFERVFGLLEHYLKHGKIKKVGLRDLLRH